MIRNEYRITLYHTQFFTELLTYDFPVLPVAGDMIEVVDEDVMFVVKSRSFKPRHDRELIKVRLCGVFENGEAMGQHTFEKIRERILDEREGVTRNRAGMVEYREFTGFPDTID